MSTYEVEIQDSAGNKYYPHTDSNVVKYGDSTVYDELVKLKLSNDNADRQTISTKNFTTLQLAINYAATNSIKNVYVDRDFANEDIIMPSNINLLSSGRIIRKINATGIKGSPLSYTAIANGYIQTTSLVAGDLVLIDKIGVYREINKVLYVDSGKAFLCDDLLFDYTNITNQKVFKISPIINISFDNLRVGTLLLAFCENVLFDTLTITHNLGIAMSYNIISNNLSIFGGKDDESRVDVYSSTRKITFSKTLLKGGNTESDNAIFKFNQISDLNLNDVIVETAYRPKNVYGYDGYFHSIMIDGVISESMSHLGDTVGYNLVPSKNINISNIIIAGHTNIYHMIFIAVVENVNIINIHGKGSLALKDCKNVNITNAQIDTLLFEGVKSNIKITNSDINILSQLNVIIDVKFSNTIIKSLVGNTNQAINISFINCDLYFSPITAYSNGVKGWTISNCFIKILSLIGVGNIDLKLNNVTIQELSLNDVSNVQGINISYNHISGKSIWVQNTKNVVLSGVVNFTELLPSLILNGGGIGYNTILDFKNSDGKNRLSFFEIKQIDLAYYNGLSIFKYGDIVTNKEAVAGSIYSWICVDDIGTLKTNSMVST